MKKTIFLSDKINIEKDNMFYKFAAPYIFFDKKWKQDTIYFQSDAMLKHYARVNNYLIK